MEKPSEDIDEKVQFNIRCLRRFVFQFVARLEKLQTRFKG